MFLWLTFALFAAGVVAIYIGYVKIRDGTQPGEPWIDRLLQRVKQDRGEPISEGGVSEDEVQRRIAAAVALAVEDTLRRVAQSVK